MVSGGVFDHGTHDEDGPVTWEALASPRHTPVLRRAGDPSPPHDAYSEGYIRALRLGNGLASWTRPRKGGPC